MVEAALEERPDDPHLHLLRATTLTGLEREVDSLAATYRAIECSQGDPESLTRAASHCFYKGDLATARRCVDCAKRFKSRGFIFRKELRELDRNLRRREKGLDREKRLSDAFDAEPSDRRVAIQLARRLGRTGRAYAGYYVVARGLYYHPEDRSLRRLKKRLGRTVPEDERSSAKMWASSGEPRTMPLAEPVGGSDPSGDDGSEAERRQAGS